MIDNSPTTAQVVVAGGGPVGSLAAYLLALAGVEVVLIDANPAPVIDYRASTFHPPTLDLLEPSGVAAALTSMGLACPIIQYRDRVAGPIAELDLSVLVHDTRYPYRLQCEQFKLTAWLQERLASFPNVQLALGARVVAVADADDHATVFTTGPDGDRTWRGRFVIGADGARSAVRHELGIPFDGYTHAEQFLVAGTRYDFKSALRDIQSINYTSDPDEWFLLLQIPDMWRIVVPVGQSVADDRARSDDYIQRCLQNICPAPTDYEILVKSVYRVHQRVAGTYRRQSVFLAGDAAHVNNPLGGVGLNGGLHDVLYLAAAIAAELDGTTYAAGLDGYEPTRRPVALRDINQMTERNKRLLEERDPAVRAANNARLRAVCADPRRAYEMALEVSMIRSLRDAGTLDSAPRPVAS